MPSAIRVLAPPVTTQNVGTELRIALRNPAFSILRASIAYSRMSGVNTIRDSLRRFVTRPGTSTQLAVGIDQGLTSLEALQDLWRLIQPTGQLFVYHDPAGSNPPTFHPKAYLFSGGAVALAIVGSSNLTRGGLFTNHEASLALDLDLGVGSDIELRQTIADIIDLHTTVGPACREIDPGLLDAMHKSGELPSETTQRRVRAASRQALGMQKSGTTTRHFGRGARPPFPSSEPEPAGLVARPVTPTSLPAVAAVPLSAPPAAAVPKTMYMQVTPHPNGEVFLSYLAVRQHPLFFGWHFTGWTEPKRATNPAYPMATPDPLVNIEVINPAGTVIDSEKDHPLNMVDYERNREIRITVPHRMAARIPNLSVLEMTREPGGNLDFLLRFHAPRSVGALAADPLMTERMPSGGSATGGRRFGWI